MITLKQEQRFYTRFHEAPGCWEWRAAKSRGYGMFWCAGRVHLAHRVSFWLAYGWLPAYVLHACDNPGCVNPGHLHAGDMALNNREKVERGRAVFPPTKVGSANPAAKLTAAQVAAIRLLRAKGLTQQAIADRFGVSQSRISRITSWNSWRLPSSPQEPSAQ